MPRKLKWFWFEIVIEHGIVCKCLYLLWNLSSIFPHQMEDHANHSVNYESCADMYCKCTSVQQSSLSLIHTGNCETWCKFSKYPSNLCPFQWFSLEVSWMLLRFWAAVLAKWCKANIFWQIQMVSHLSVQAKLVILSSIVINLHHQHILIVILTVNKTKRQGLFLVSRGKRWFSWDLRFGWLHAVRNWITVQDIWRCKRLVFP